MTTVTLTIVCRCMCEFYVAISQEPGDARIACPHCGASSLARDTLAQVPVRNMQVTEFMPLLVEALARSHGVCRKCGCTDSFACEGGCAWVNAEHTLCSRCVRST